MKRYALAVVLFPLVALAQAVEPAPSGLSFEQLVGAAAAVVVPLFLVIAAKVWGEMKSARIAQVEKAISIAYNATNEVAKYTATKVDDKVAYALGVFRDMLRSQGYTPTVDDEVIAKAGFKAMHGVEKQVLNSPPVPRS